MCPQGLGGFSPACGLGTAGCWLCAARRAQSRHSSSPPASPAGPRSAHSISAAGARSQAVTRELSPAKAAAKGSAGHPQRSSILATPVPPH